MGDLLGTSHSRFWASETARGLMPHSVIPEKTDTTDGQSRPSREYRTKTERVEVNKSEFVF